MTKTDHKYNSISWPVRLSGWSLYRAGLTVVLLVIGNLALSSCAALTIRNPLPEQYVQEAQIKDMPFARFWGDEMPSDWQERLIELKNIFLQLTGMLRERRLIIWRFPAVVLMGRLAPACWPVGQQPATGLNSPSSQVSAPVP